MRLPVYQWPLWAPLASAAAVYAAVLEVRKRWWRAMACDAGIPVISVGNLTVGGNGKTPFTLFLASLLARHGLAVGIVSRGWGSVESGADAALVSDGARILLAPRAAGDEPSMMAKAYAGPIAIARRRLDGIRLLTRSFALDAIVLDDGFQHVRLKRDLDLLLVNETRGFGNGWILPAGPLREPLSAIDRADAIILINPLINANADGIDSPCGPSAEHGAALSPAARARLSSRTLLHATVRPHALVRAAADGWHEMAFTLDGVRVAAVSGIADARGFHAMLRGLGAKVTRTLDYPDHHDYSPADWENILDAARGSEMLVTTEKDLVKLEGFSTDNISLCALRLAVTMDAEDRMRLLGMVRASASSRIMNRPRA
ncbi:MAG: tetraacyldisaccharide 4'-kinase [Candidatus Binataceae bacterium]